MSREKRPTPEAPRRHLSASVLSLGASYGVALVAIALTSVGIARLLGSSGIGIFAIASALLWLFAILFDLGVGQGTAYYVARGEWRGWDLSLGVLRACVALGAIGAAAMLLAFDLLGDLVPGMDWPMAVALAAALPFALVWRIGPQVALARERFELFALFNSCPALLACPLSVGLAVVGGARWAVIGLAVAFVLTGALIAGWLVREGHRQRTESRAPAGGTLAVVSFGARAWLSELLQQVNLRADLILLGAFVGAAASGVYSLALTTTAIAWQLTEALAVSALPRSARMHAESEREQISSADRDESDSRLVRHAVLAIPAVAAVELLLLLVGIPVFYGPDFHRSIGLGFILLVGSLALGVGRTALAVVLARGFPNRLLMVGLAVVPGTVLAYVLVLPTAGATGAAVVASCSYLAFAVIGVGVMRASTEIALPAALLPTSLDLGDYRLLLQRLRQEVRARWPASRSGVSRRTPTLPGRQMTLLSVVTPVRNQATYLEETLDSVAALTVPHEHIVVDGASDDGTIEVLEARDDQNLSWTSEPDRGQTDAVNKGFARAGGDLVSWVNGDDAYVPDAVDRAIAYLDANPDVGAIYGGQEYINAEGEVIRTFIPKRFSWRRYLYLGDNVPTPTVIFRRSVLEQSGGLDPHYADAADYDFYLRILGAVRVEPIREPLVRFRYHEHSKTGSNIALQLDEGLEIRLKRARGPVARFSMRALERAKRAILPRISSWPNPEPRGLNRINAALTGSRRRSA